MQASALSKASLRSCKRIKHSRVAGWDGTAELDSQQCLSPLHLLLCRREGLPHHPVSSFFSKPTSTTQLKAHRTATVPLSFRLPFPAPGFHFNMRTRARGYRRLEGRNLSVLGLRSRQLLGDKKEGWIRRLRCRFCGEPSYCRK